MKLDIGGGVSKGDGWTTIDINPGADIVHDITIFPWPVKSGSCSELRMFHTLEHLPPESALNVMKECYRVAEPGAMFEIRIPWWEYDLHSCPYHLNWFRPRWFYWLSREKQGTKGARDAIGDMAWCPAMYHQHGDLDWRVQGDHITRGRHKFWKKYEYRVWLKKFVARRGE